MRRKINGEAYLIIKKNYTLIIRNSNSDPKITLLIEPTTITTYKPDNQQESFSDKDTLPNDHLQTL